MRVQGFFTLKVQRTVRVQGVFSIKSSKSLEGLGLLTKHKM